MLWCCNVPKPGGDHMQPSSVLTKPNWERRRDYGVTTPQKSCAMSNFPFSPVSGDEWNCSRSPWSVESLPRQSSKKGRATTAWRCHPVSGHPRCQELHVNSRALWISSYLNVDHIWVSIVSERYGEQRCSGCFVRRLQARLIRARSLVPIVPRPSPWRSIPLCAREVNVLLLVQWCKDFEPFCGGEVEKAWYCQCSVELNLTLFCYKSAPVPRWRVRAFLIAS